MLESLFELTGSWSFYFWLFWIVVGVLLAFQLGGWRLGLAGALLGGSLSFFLLGRKIERDSFEKRANDIQEKRKKAYEEIDSRPVSLDVIRQRLSERDY